MSTSLASLTKLKVQQLYPQSFIRLIDNKKDIFFISHKNGIHTYDISNNKIQQLKLDRNQYSGPYSCITVSDELVFFCCGSRVLAMGSNFKILYEMDTFLAVQRIDSIYVIGYRMFLISQNMMNQFLIGGVQLMNKKSRITQSPGQKSQDVSEQVFDAKINHSLLITITAQKPFLVLLKSNNQIQVYLLQKIKGERNQSVYFQTSTPPTYAYLYPQNIQNENRILVGTAGGQILYLQVNRKQIKKIWEITQKKGRISTICGLRDDGFFVTRQKSIEFWNKTRQLIKEQSIQQKVTCSTYLTQQNILLYGTSNGSLIEMQNYEKLIKQSQKVSQKKQKQQLIKQIQLLRYKKSLLETKLNQKKKLQKQKMNATMSQMMKKINVKASISIDYSNLCYNIEIESQQKICKVIVQGPIILVQQKQNIFFQGQNQNTSKSKVYIVRYQNQTNITIKVKYQEVFNQLQKLNLLIYFSFQSRVHNIQIDLKQLSLHQKVSLKSFDTKKNLNKMEIGGNYKFQMKMWLNSIFNQFATEPNQQSFQEACYESIITKNKIYVKFKHGYCLLLSESVIPLLLIKKKLQQKARQKNISLSFDTNTNTSSVKQFVLGLQPRMKQFYQVKRKYELLPGLLQIKNDLSIQKNQDLLKILEQRDSIMNSYKQNSKLEQQIKQKIMEFYRCFKILNNQEVKEIQQKSLLQAIDKWDSKSIITTICRQ